MLLESPRLNRSDYDAQSYAEADHTSPSDEQCMRNSVGMLKPIFTQDIDVDRASINYKMAFKYVVQAWSMVGKV